MQKDYMAQASLGLSHLFPFQEIFVNEINRWSYKWGLCVPSACNEIDVMLTYEILLDSFVNPINLKAGNISIHATTALPSQTKENQQPVFETGNIVFM